MSLIRLHQESHYPPQHITQRVARWFDYQWIPSRSALFSWTCDEYGQL